MAVVHSFVGQPATADEVVIPTEPVFTYTTTTAPDLTATAFYSVDTETARPLASLAADTVLPIASITKLITTAVYQQSLPDTTQPELITVTNADVNGMGRAGALQVGEVYPRTILPFPALITSANSASALMARSGAGTLVADTNTYARQQGFSNTTIDDAHGLSARNVSTARELAAWFTHISEAAPTVRDITRLKQYLAADNGWINNSPFIHDSRYQGGKHGYTDAAGRTVVAAFTEPVAGGPDREIIYVLLGSDDLVADMARLRQHVTSHASYQ